MIKCAHNNDAIEFADGFPGTSHVSLSISTRTEIHTWPQVDRILPSGRHVARLTSLVPSFLCYSAFSEVGVLRYNFKDLPVLALHFFHCLYFWTRFSSLTREFFSIRWVFRRCVDPFKHGKPVTTGNRSCLFFELRRPNGSYICSIKASDESERLAVSKRERLKWLNC